MIKVNEYFEGTVKSIALENNEGVATVGVMEVGEYLFGTKTLEYMTVISGELQVLLPDEKEWMFYTKNQTFVVQKDCQFKVRTTVQTAYFCLYK